MENERVQQIKLKYLCQLLSLLATFPLVYSDSLATTSLSAKKRYGLRTGPFPLGFFVNIGRVELS